MLMHKIEAGYKVVTPLFGSGADANRPELRTTAFKGLLRFWWRALAWSRLRGDLTELKRQEDRLFGSATGGQSKVLMCLKAPPATVVRTDQVLTIPGGGGKTVGEGARYLGYGLMEAFASSQNKTQAGQLLKACLQAPVEFCVQIRGRDLSPQDLESLKNALVCLGLLGGMGSRSRKGYGSLVLQALSLDGQAAWTPPKNLAELERAIKELNSWPSPGQNSLRLPEYTAFSPTSRCVLLTGKKDPLEMLDLVVREMVRYRSWGKNGKILGGGVVSEKNFQDDHDLMKRAVRTEHPRRVAFELPHNYGKAREDQVGPADAHLDRRASPLFIHIHELRNEAVAILSFLPARFLPERRPDPKAGSGGFPKPPDLSVGTNRVPLAPEAQLYRPIHDFLDRLLDKNKRKETFASALEVKP
jgi:CRISPR-associated protein Cmr1